MVRAVFPLPSINSISRLMVYQLREGWSDKLHRWLAVDVETECCNLLHCGCLGVILHLRSHQYFALAKLPSNVVIYSDIIWATACAFHGHWSSRKIERQICAVQILSLINHQVLYGKVYLSYQHASGIAIILEVEVRGLNSFMNSMERAGSKFSNF